MNIQFEDSTIKSTLKKTSYDKDGKEYLLEDEREVIDFDEVSKQIAQQIRLGNKARSCDALYIGTEYIYLIEFKNRKLSDLKRSKPELHEKAYDSIFQLQLYLNKEEYLDELTGRTRLLVIYNDAKNAEDSKTDVASSESVNNIVRKMKGFAKLKGLDAFPKRFGLGNLEGKLYEKVVTMDVRDFDDEIKNIVFG